MSPETLILFLHVSISCGQAVHPDTPTQPHFPPFPTKLILQSGVGIYSITSTPGLRKAEPCLLTDPEDWHTGSCRSQAKPAGIKITKGEQTVWCFLCIRIKLGTSPSRYICRGSSLTFAASLTRDITVPKILDRRDTDKIYNMNVNILKGEQLQEQF